MRRNRNNIKKEKMIMLASSVFVLTALTMTGVYVKEKNDSQNNGEIIDFSQLEDQVEHKTNEIAEAKDESNQEMASNHIDPQSDLDYDPSYTETNSPNVENILPSVDNQAADEQAAKDEKEEEQKKEEQTDSQEADVAAGSTNVEQAISFGERDTLQWPIVGNVLLNYSMDKAVYFSTLEQYKYNPAIVIAAVEGEPITAAAAGTVVNVYQDDEIGNAVVMDLGNGYELTYGQLKDITVKNGDKIATGTILGFVNTPTKYYSIEGCNVYFKLTKDGTPVNPMNRLS